MRFSKIFAGSTLGLRAGQVAAQGYQCPLSMSAEITALKFAYGVQKCLYQYYTAKAGMSVANYGLP